ncbi:MAG TPA: biotin/lipoyl-containing protein [Candidatus Binataceae bacterium]|nr:biotin/lipoyl-containing protein [Candidatus Binataceae bacterium]
MKLRPAGEQKVFEVEILDRKNDAIRARIDGEEISAVLENRAGRLALKVGDQSVRVNVVRGRNAILVAVGPAQFEFAPIEASGRRRAQGLSAQEITAPLPGKVLKILVEENQVVEHGAPLIVLEAMKMETTLAAESRAVIAKIRAEVGAMVDHGAVLIELSPPPADSSAT